MVGKKIGIQATGKILLTALLKKHDIEEKDVEVVVIGSDFDAAADRPGRRGDRLADLDHQRQGCSAAAVTLRLWDAGVKLYALPMYATRDTLEKKPAMLAGFLQAPREGLGVHPEEPREGRRLRW